MPIALGQTNIGKAYLGSTALTQIYLGDVPLLGSAPQVDLPPVDGYFLLLDAGVEESWDGVDTHWRDLATADVNGPYPYSKSASVIFNGEVGVRGNNTYFENVVENENFSEDGVNRSFLEKMHQRNIGPYTYIAIVDLDNSAVDDSPSWIVANGTNQSSNRASFSGGDNSGNITVNFSGRTGGINWGGASGNFPEGWKDRYRPRMITIVGDSSDASDCFTKLDGFPSQPTDPTHNNSNTGTSTPRFGLNANGLTNVGTRYYVLLCYDRKLTEAEVQQIEDFYMPYFPDPSNSVKGSWGVRNLEPTDGGTGGREWTIGNVVPVVGGVADYSGYGAVVSLTQSGWSNVGNILSASGNATSLSEVSAANVEEILSAFFNTVNAEQIQVYQGNTMVNRNHLSRMMVVASDDQGVTTYDVAKIKAYPGRDNWGGSDPTNYRFGVPTQQMTDDYSMEARSIIAQYPGATLAQMDAMAVFIDTLETNAYLDRMIEMYPLFMPGTAGLKAAFRAPNLEVVGSPVKLTDGWWFPTSDDYLMHPSGARMQQDGQWPHNAAAGAAAMTMFQLNATNHGSSGDYFEVFGASDGSLRFARIEIQASNARIRDGLMRTGTNTGTSGKIPNALLPVGVPITWFTRSNNHTWWKNGANATESLNTSASSADMPQARLTLNRIDDNGVIASRPSIGGVWSMFIMWDLNGLDDTQRDTMLGVIHTAMQTMMDTLGIVPIDVPVTYDPIENHPDWTLLYGAVTAYTLVDDLVDELVSLTGTAADNATASRGQAIGTDIELEVDWINVNAVAGNSWGFPLIIRADAAGTNLIGVRVMDGTLQAQAFENNIWGTTHTVTLAEAALPGKLRFRAVGTTVSVFVDDVLKITFETTNVSGGDHYGVRTASQQANLGQMWKNLVVTNL